MQSNMIDFDIAVLVLDNEKQRRTRDILARAIEAGREGELDEWVNSKVAGKKADSIDEVASTFYETIEAWNSQAWEEAN